MLFSEKQDQFTAESCYLLILRMDEMKIEQKKIRIWF